MAHSTPDNPSRLNSKMSDNAPLNTATPSTHYSQNQSQWLTLRKLGLTLIIFLGLSHPAQALEKSPSQESPLTIIEPTAQAIGTSEPPEEANDPLFEVIEDVPDANPLPPTDDPVSETRELAQLRHLTLPNRINISRAGPVIAVNYRNPRVRRGDTLSISLAPTGTTRRTWTSSPIAAYGAGVQTLTIPTTELARYIGQSSVLTVAVARGNGRITLSRPRTVSVVVTSGNDIASRLNTRYRNTANRCTYAQRNDYPAYYCNGIILRTVDNGNFDPWMPSNSAIDLKGISFSYFRVDSNVTNVYRNAGFIFLPQREAYARGNAIDYLCIYAYDAWTLTGKRNMAGCGLRPRIAAGNDVSTCASQGATTEEGWYTYVRKAVDHNSYQCSFSTRDAAQFALSLTVRRNPPADVSKRVRAPWNELMAELWVRADERNPFSAERSKEVASRLPIEAFFYRRGNTTSRDDAKAFQKKFKALTNIWVPIVAMDLNQLNGSPFSYNPDDQEVQR